MCRPHYLVCLLLSPHSPRVRRCPVFLGFCVSPGSVLFPGLYVLNLFRALLIVVVVATDFICCCSSWDISGVRGNMVHGHGLLSEYFYKDCYVEDWLFRDNYYDKAQLLWLDFLCVGGVWGEFDNKKMSVGKLLGKMIRLWRFRGIEKIIMARGPILFCVDSGEIAI